MGVFDSLDELLVLDEDSSGEAVQVDDNVSTSESSGIYDIKTVDNESAVKVLKEQPVSNVRTLFNRDVTFPYFEIEISNNSTMNMYELGTLQEMLTSSSVDVLDANKLAELAETKEITSISVGVQHLDDNGSVVGSKVIGTLGKARLKQLRSLTRAMITRFYPDENTCLDGDSVLALY